MTRKLVVVAAHSQRPSESLARQLRRLVPQDVEVVARSPQTGFDQPPDCDAVLAATALMTSQLGPWLPAGIPVITAVRTLRRTAWEQMIALPPPPAPAPCWPRRRAAGPAAGDGPAQGMGVYGYRPGYSEPGRCSPSGARTVTCA